MNLDALPEPFRSEIERLKKSRPILFFFAYWMGRGIAFLSFPLRFVWWIFFGNFYRLVNWWFFWPFCIIGIHSRKPAVFYPVGHWNTGDGPKLGCKACYKQVYGPFISWDDAKAKGYIK